ncbi:DUF1492 domain-containing protein, partial [Ruminococcaceae bacterium OttesenSCG-928-I18]|nr:DUF1492 domain-containing protein [Ruminococcaceae bacterium OttesenSCG-928-I18]
MITKEYLRQARRLKVAINGKTERLEQLRSIAESTSVPIGDMPRGGGDPQRMAHIVDTIVDFSREIAESTAPLVEMQREIQKIINKIPRLEYRTVLELYYLNGYGWRKTASLMHYSERQVFRVHDA